MLLDQFLAGRRNALGRVQLLLAEASRCARSQGGASVTSSVVERVIELFGDDPETLDEVASLLKTLYNAAQDGHPYQARVLGTCTDPRSGDRCSWRGGS